MHWDGLLTRGRDNYSLNCRLIKCRRQAETVRLLPDAAAMLNNCSARSVYLVLMLLAMSALAAVAATLLMHTFAASLAKGLMLGWVLAFSAGLPVALLLLPVMGALGPPARHTTVIPRAGDNIPSTGQSGSTRSGSTQSRPTRSWPAR